MQREGLPSDGRRFSPHVTLARLQGASEAHVAGFVAQHNLFRAPPFRAESFTLVLEFPVVVPGDLYGGSGIPADRAYQQP